MASRARSPAVRPAASLRAGPAALIGAARLIGLGLTLTALASPAAAASRYT